MPASDALPCSIAIEHLVSMNSAGSCDSMVSTNSGFSDDSMEYLSAEERACLMFLEETIESLEADDDSGVSIDESDHLNYNQTPQVKHLHPISQTKSEDVSFHEDPNKVLGKDHKPQSLLVPTPLVLANGSPKIPKKSSTVSTTDQKVVSQVNDLNIRAPNAYHQPAGNPVHVPNPGTPEPIADQSNDQADLPPSFIPEPPVKFNASTDSKTRGNPPKTQLEEKLDQMHKSVSSEMLMELIPPPSDFMDEPALPAPALVQPADQKQVQAQIKTLTQPQAEPQTLVQQKAQPQVQTQVQIKGQPQAQTQGLPKEEPQGQPLVPTQGQPQVPTQGQPPVPTQSQPQVPSQGQPQVPIQGQPQVLTLGQPPVPTQSQHQVPTMGQPQVPTLGQPPVFTQSQLQVPSQDQPQVPTMGQPQVPTLAQPQVPSQGQPQVPTQGQLPVPTMGQPKVPTQGQFQEPTQGQPQVTPIGQPQVPTQGQLPVPTMGQPKVPTQGQFQVPTQGQPQVPPIGQLQSQYQHQLQPPPQLQVQPPTENPESITISPPPGFGGQAEDEKPQISKGPLSPGELEKLRKKASLKKAPLIAPVVVAQPSNQVSDQASYPVSSPDSLPVTAVEHSEPKSPPAVAPKPKKLPSNIVLKSQKDSGPNHTLVSVGDRVMNPQKVHIEALKKLGLLKADEPDAGLSLGSSPPSRILPPAPFNTAPPTGQVPSTYAVQDLLINPEKQGSLSVPRGPSPKPFEFKSATLDRPRAVNPKPFEIKSATLDRPRGTSLKVGHSTLIMTQEKSRESSQERSVELSPGQLRRSRPRPVSAGSHKDLGIEQLTSGPNREADMGRSRGSSPAPPAQPSTDSQKALRSNGVISVVFTPHSMTGEDRKQALRKLGLIRD